MNSGPSSDQSAEMISGDRTRSIENLKANSLRAAEGLRQLGVGRGDTVAILLRNDFAFFEASLAATALGASPVAINWHLAPQEIRYVIDDCGASVLIAHADLLNLLGDMIPDGLTVLGIDTPKEIVRAYGIEPERCNLAANIKPWDTWLMEYQPLSDVCRDFNETMTYTSGTTGKPKGVRRFPQSSEEAAAFLEIRDRVYGIKPGIRQLLCGPLYHAAPNAFAMRAMTTAYSIVLMPRFDAEQFLEHIERYRITTVFMVPTMFIRLLKLPANIRARYDVSSLQHVLTAAAHCPAHVKSAMIDWFGPIVHEFLGSTEASYISYCSPQDAIRKPGSVGQLVEGVNVRFIDENGEDAAPGEPGEIYTRLSYAPDFTYANQEAERKGLELDGLIATGDVGYLDEDGYLFLCDRRRDMVISGGVNIYPAEIEAEMLTIEGISDCAVIGIPDPEYGEKLMAVVVPEPDATLDSKAIIESLKGRLARFKIPRLIEMQNSLPRDDAGKIYKRRLREVYSNT